MPPKIGGWGSRQLFVINSPFCVPLYTFTFYTSIKGRDAHLCLFLYLFPNLFPTTSLPLPNTPTPASCFICCSNSPPRYPLQSSHHSLHHLFISSPATVPSPFGEGVSVGLSGEGQGSKRRAPTTKRALQSCDHRALTVKKAATYSPTLHCSTIGASGLNFSVRNGKRWDPAAITA